MDYFKKGKEGVKTANRITRICQAFSIVIVVLLASMAQDFVITALSKADSYDLVCQAEETLGNGQTVWRLYRDGECMGDVDPNRYNLLDSSGSTDYRYCALTEHAGILVYSVIMGIMLCIIINIIGSTAKGTPFTRKNVRRIRAISLLQLALAILPGTVRMIMTLFRFDYASGSFSVDGIYMLIISFIIAMIAQVFDYGVRLQEDSDSIA